MPRGRSSPGWLALSSSIVPVAAIAAVPAIKDCPAALHGHPIGEVGLLTGDVKDQAIQVPDGETADGSSYWGVATGTDGWFKVQCRYRGTRRTVVFPVPAGARQCRLGGPGGANVSCR